MIHNFIQLWVLPRNVLAHFKYIFKEFAPGDPQENRDLYDLLFYTHFLYAHGTRGSGVGASVPNFEGVFGHPKIVLEKAAHSLFAKFPSAKLHYYIELIGDDFEHVNKWISRVTFFFFFSTLIFN